MKKVALIATLLLFGCGGPVPLHRVCRVQCESPIELTTLTSVEDIAVVSSGFANGTDCADHAVLLVGAEETRRLFIGDTDLGVTLLNVRPEDGSPWKIDVCLDEISR